MLTVDERLYVPHRKRMYHSYGTNAEGARELRIDYGIKEITFDEEHLFAFGERLVKEASFTGAEATTWGPGYAWDELQPLLEALLEEGVIKRGGGDGADTDARGGGLVPSLVKPSVCPVPRFWSAQECPSISRDLAERSFEIGHLEAVMPVYRIAHPALDADGRQVGEGNVVPPRLRLDIETEWRVCQYSGSRYRDQAPMNVSGLRAMIKYWKPMMATLLRIRAAIRDRLGASAHWTISELQVMAAAVLAVPTYQLMKGGGSTPQRPLHPVLSSLFRITDGIRMTTYEMLISIEHARPPDEPMTAAQLYDYAENHAVLIGDTGVCAGPKPMIDEFLLTAVDGVVPEGVEGLALPDEVDALLTELPAALDYGFLGLQAQSLSLSVWIEMSRAYQKVMPLLRAASASNEPCARLFERLKADWKVLAFLQITKDFDREVHWNAYRVTYEPSWRAARTKVGAALLAEAVSPAPALRASSDAAGALRSLLRARFSEGDLVGALDAGAVDQLADALVELLRHEQAVLAATEAVLDAINALLDRPRPARPLGVRDFQAYYSIGTGKGSFPYLFDTLESELGVHVDASARDIVVTDRRAS